MTYISTKWCGKLYIFTSGCMPISNLDKMLSFSQNCTKNVWRRVVGLSQLSHLFAPTNPVRHFNWTGALEDPSRFFHWSPPPCFFGVETREELFSSFLCSVSLSRQSSSQELFSFNLNKSTIEFSFNLFDHVIYSLSSYLLLNIEFSTNPNQFDPSTVTESERHLVRPFSATVGM